MSLLIKAAVEVGDTAITVAAADTPETLKSRADYVCDGTETTGGDQSDINNALAVADTVVLCPGTFWIDGAINVGSNQALIGSGPSTIIKLVNAHDAALILITITSSSSNVKIANLVIDGNEAAQSTGDQQGIYTSNTEHIQIIGCHIRNLRLWGVAIDGISPYLKFIGNTVENCNAKDQVGRGGVSLGYVHYSTISGNLIFDTTSIGLKVMFANQATISGNVISSTSDNLFLQNCNYMTVSGNTTFGTGPTNGVNILIVNCVDTAIDGNSCYANVYGIRARGGSVRVSITNNVICNTSSYGISLGSNDESASHCIVSGNIIYEVANADIKVEGAAAATCDYNVIVDNILRYGVVRTPDYGVDISAYGQYTTVVGNDFRDSWDIAPINDAGLLSHIDGNLGAEITDEKVYVTSKNTSGGALAAGDVVILKSVAAGNEITTTITAGDDKVFGMAAEAIADNASGLVLVEGKTVALKVNGTTAIDIGDFLCTYTEAGISQRAAAGDMAFAIALEAYAVADSNGVIDALLISPRKI